jgi:hypothetical protein
MGVTPEARSLFEEVHLMPAAEKPRRSESGNPTPDHSDLHHPPSRLHLNSMVLIETALATRTRRGRSNISNFRVFLEKI